MKNDELVILSLDNVGLYITVIKFGFDINDRKDPSIFSHFKC